MMGSRDQIAANGERQDIENHQGIVHIALHKNGTIKGV